MRTIFLSAGETSGDLHGARLALALREMDPDVRLVGLGGPAMAEAGVELLEDLTQHAATGLVEILGRIGTYRRILKRAAGWIAGNRPDVVVPIDFPDFHFLLMKRIRPHVRKIAYYISPQVWAWRRRRVKRLRETVDRMVVIFPFEEAFYQKEGIPVTFVGHPLADALDPEGLAAAGRQLLAERGIGPEETTVGILPGSRRNEIARIGPIFARAANCVAARIPEAAFLVAAAPGIPPETYMETFGEVEGRLHILPGRSREILAACTAAMTATGTATVEAAMLGCPMVAAYKVHPATALLVRGLLKIDTFAMANIIAGRRIVPERIQSDATPEGIAEALLPYLEDPERRAATVADLAGVRAALGPPGASRRAAAAILELTSAPAA